ncbi:MAG TPA: hypothetical protein VG778_08965 [Blastocatellia bacterium]|nr:hypothetical protein [Blastocatellia bacterium]
MRNGNVLVLASVAVLGMAVIASGRQPMLTSLQYQHSAVEEQKHEAGHASQQDSHHTGVNQRGDRVMGFEHTRTTHHFRLNAHGGVIDVSVNDPNDSASREQIRTHLKHIAQKFAQGDFTAPMLIHAQTPPGVSEMKRLKADIKYEFESTERGALVRITTTSAKAIEAVHEFLLFQIKDHQTGDSGEIEKPSSF